MAAIAEPDHVQHVLGSIAPMMVALDAPGRSARGARVRLGEATCPRRTVGGISGPLALRVGGPVRPVEAGQHRAPALRTPVGGPGRPALVAPDVPHHGVRRHARCAPTIPSASKRLAIGTSGAGGASAPATSALNCSAADS